MSEAVEGSKSAAMGIMVDSATKPAAVESAVKYESPYAEHPPRNTSPSMKRRDSGSTAGDEKRQRIGSSQVAQSVEAPGIEEDEFARILAMASESATQQFQTGSTSSNQVAPQSNYTPLATDLYTSTASTTPPNSSLYWADPHLYTRVMSLPMLEISVIPILGAFAQNSFEEAVSIQAQPDSELGQAFEAQKSLFDQTKKMYARNKAFLSADELNIIEPEHRSKIRMANLATFVSSVFGSQEVGFYELNDHFVDIFATEGEPLSKAPAALFLDLKVQMFITALSEEEQEKTKEEHLEELFPADMEQILLARHSDSELHADELEFIREMRSMQNYLKDEAGDLESISNLSSKYKWEDFLRGLRDHLKKAYEHSVIEPYMRRNSLKLPAPKPVKSEPEELNLDFLEDDIKMATQAAMESFTQFSPQPPNNQYTSQYPQQHQAANGFNQTHLIPSSGENGSPVPYPTQTAPTSVLYEQARQAAVAKFSPHSRRPGLPSQRRPWSPEEENALMTGLDKVKGPHWSQILLLYGPNGTLSEVLKDRNQVQLKDKARNLKLFFLKNNIEVPYYLQTVTGELKTRAPTQAARREAEDKNGDAIAPTGDVASPTESNPGTPQSFISPTTIEGKAISDDGPEVLNVTGEGSKLDVKENLLDATGAAAKPQDDDDEIDFEKTLMDAMQQHNAAEAANRAVEKVDAGEMKG